MEDIIVEIEDEIKDICDAIYTVGVAAGKFTNQVGVAAGKFTNEEIINGLFETKELLTRILCEKVKAEIEAEVSLSKLDALNTGFNTGDDRK